MSDDGVGGGGGDADADTGGRSLRYHVDSDLVPAGSASVPVTDRGFLYGDATFETFHTCGGEVFHWDVHADRLVETCDALGMSHGLSDDGLHARIDETLTANDLNEAYARLSVTRGGQGGRSTPTEVADLRVVVIVEPLSRGGRGSDPAWDDPATVQAIKTRRILDQSLPARARTHNYLNSIFARVGLRITGADEALMLDVGGYVTEGTMSNLFFVDDDALCTLGLDGPVPLGITRRIVFDLARQESVPIRERRSMPDDTRDASETFLTNSMWELWPIGTVGSIEVGDGPVTKLLSRLYDDYVERCHYDGDGDSDDVDNGGDTDSVGGDES